MNMQLHQAFGIVAGRAWSDQDRALVRDAELARAAGRRRFIWRGRGGR